MSKINRFQEKKNAPMTNGCDMFLSTVILKFRKQMAILTLTQARNQMCFWLNQTWGKWFGSCGFA